MARPNHQIKAVNPSAEYTIPSVEVVQKQLIDYMFSAARTFRIDPILIDCTNSPRPSFEIAAGTHTNTFISTLLDFGLTCKDATTNKTLDISEISNILDKEQCLKIVIYKPLVIMDRVIHGVTSGIIIVLSNAPKTKADLEKITIPDERFGALPINAQLSGYDIEVCKTLPDEIAAHLIPPRLDIVYTWVDDNDPLWQAKRRRFAPENPTADAEHGARFVNKNELLFSLRSLFRYFKGVGKVFLVTDGQIPDFIGEFRGKVIIVSHAEIMEDVVAQPTFNSHVIESCLHKINGLGEHYLYLNDDFLFAKPTCPAHFFDVSGRAKCFFSRKNKIPSGGVTAKTVASDAAGMNLKKILAEKHEYHITKKMQHAPVAVTKSTMQLVEDAFENEFSKLQANRFRSQNDLSPMGSLYQHYAIMIGHAQDSKIAYRYYDTGELLFLLKLFKLSIEGDIQRPNVLCLNSIGRQRMASFSQKPFMKILNTLYPAENIELPHRLAKFSIKRKIYVCLLGIYFWLQALKNMIC